MRIAQVMASDAWGGISPEMLERGIGGREGAMIRLGREWARHGHEVTNFVPTAEGIRYDEDPYDGACDGYHEFVPVGLSTAMLSNFDYDAVVAWECPSVFNNAAVTGRQPVRLVEMQCAHFVSEADQYAAGTVATGVVALSPWHRDFMVYDGLEIDPSRLHVLPNCVDLERYPERDDHQLEEKFYSSTKLFYSSSPDRGLWHLLRMWPQMLNSRPDARLFLGYGVRRWISQLAYSHYRVGEMAVEIARLIQQPGVVDMGVVGQSELAKVQGECQAWLYPCDSIQPTETGCITAVEAMAAYCPAIMSDADCLGEEFGGVARIVPLPHDESDWAQAVSEIFVPETWLEMAKRGRAFAEKRQWKDVALEWVDLFKRERDRA